MMDSEAAIDPESQMCCRTIFTSSSMKKGSRDITITHNFDWYTLKE